MNTVPITFTSYYYKHVRKHKLLIGTVALPAICDQTYRSFVRAHDAIFLCVPVQRKNKKHWEHLVYCSLSR